MLVINRVRIEIDTIKGKYGFDRSFTKGLNFIVSNGNTRGKSAILLAIYYALGFEQLIGGHGSQILSKAYKKKIKDGNVELNVLESGVYVEISNGMQVNTLYRAGKSENRESKLITVYKGDIDQVLSNSCSRKDYYVNMRNSATNEFGFHHYLEKFLGLGLPIVPQQDGSERKLYLQLVFSAMLIEQKRGWADFYSSMPNLGVKDPKRRVPEYILGLDKLAIAKKKSELKNRETDLKNRWYSLREDIFMEAKLEKFLVDSIPLKPEIIDNDSIKGIKLIYADQGEKSVEDIIEDFRNEINRLSNLEPKIVDNYEELETELIETELEAEKMRDKVSKLNKNLITEQNKIKSLEYNIQIIENDLQNNYDARKLKKLGSDIGVSTMEGKCPLCNQSIDDSLLPTDVDYLNMSIEDNIRHLKAQKNALEYALANHKNNLDSTKNDLYIINENLSVLRRLAKFLRNDLYKVDEDVSEAMIYKRIELEKKVESILLLNESFQNKKKRFKEISDEWKEYLNDKANLPSGDLSEDDTDKLNEFESNFIDNLESFRFSSELDYKDLTISPLTYLPEMDGFDMKFDSSASDHIRVIWAFTLALLQTSLVKNGNHPGLVIFDEPAQHSIVLQDLVALFKCIQSIKGDHQTILAITINSNEINEVLNEFEKENNIIHLEDLAFKKFQS
ncbi:MAG: hypothetical protein JJT76_09655 [Clostridiaceae bacterium]|nr:hypothetical protein [Clostridiaceae bacterium]